MSNRYDGLQEIIDEALDSMAAEAGDGFDPQRCNLAEFCRRTGLSRQRARTIKAIVRTAFSAPSGNSQKHAAAIPQPKAASIKDQIMPLGIQFL